MPNIYDIAAAHRKAILTAERDTAKEMAAYYGETWQSIRKELDSLLGEIEYARKHGKDVAPEVILRQGRLRALQGQIEDEIYKFSQVAYNDISAAQRAAIALAQLHTEEYVARAYSGARGIVNFNRLPVRALEQLAGQLASGSPLRSVLASLAPEAKDGVTQLLFTGLALGRNPRAMAQDAADCLGASLHRALLICRTETMRAYRETSHATYRKNHDVIEGWVWSSALSARSCAACIAMHGTRHDARERLDDHPGGRCVPLPLTKTWEELGLSGIPETRPQIESGASWLSRQDKQTQDEILGPAAANAYREGAVRLADFVGRKDSPDWGTMRYTRSLKDVLASSTR